jgi:hypothetical protein
VAALECADPFVRRPDAEEVEVAMRGRTDLRSIPCLCAGLALSLLPPSHFPDVTTISSPPGWATASESLKEWEANWLNMPRYNAGYV